MCDLKEGRATVQGFLSFNKITVYAPYVFDVHSPEYIQKVQDKFIKIQTFVMHVQSLLIFQGD